MCSQVLQQTAASRWVSFPNTDFLNSYTLKMIKTLKWTNSGSQSCFLNWSFCSVRLLRCTHACLVSINYSQFHLWIWVWCCCTNLLSWQLHYDELWIFLLFVQYIQKLLHSLIKITDKLRESPKLVCLFCIVITSCICMVWYGMVLYFLWQLMGTRTIRPTETCVNLWQVWQTQKPVCYNPGSPSLL